MASTRREFLRTGVLGTLGLGMAGSLQSVLAAGRPVRRTAAAGGDTVVVAVILDGGKDGLNTVVPLPQYERYRELRPTLGWTLDELIALPGYEQDFAVNAGLQTLVDLFRQGKVAIVNGVGYPPGTQGQFNHEGSMANLQAGDTHGVVPTFAPTGWLGRFLDDAEPGALPGGIDFGSTALLLTGSRTEPLSLRALSDFGISPSGDAAARLQAYARIQNLPTPPGVMERSSRLRRQMLGLSDTLHTISSSYEVTPGVVYPAGDAGALFRDCAALIAADQGVRCLGVDFGFFDTHGSQNAGAPIPLHQALLKLVSDGVAALHADLVGHGMADRVVILVLSEFGRRAWENSLLGTDHGVGSVVLAIGDPVKGGVYGDYPDLREQYLILDG